MLSVKNMMVRILTSPFIGWVIQLVTRDQIRFQGILIYTGYPQISQYVKACLFWGLYEKQEARFIQRYLPSNLPVIELGASIGVISCIVAQKVSPQPVYSIEANPSLILIIENNLKLNNLGNGKVLNLALGGTGEVFFTPGNDNTVGIVTSQKRNNSVVISSSSLNRITAKLGIGKFNLVCDIEGSEVEFLFHDSASLVNCEHLIIELHNTSQDGVCYSVGQMKERIRALGFVIRDEHGPVIVASRTA